MSIAANLAAVRERISQAAGRAGRDPASVSLLGVTKGQGVEKVREAIEEGLLWLGESKIQEARVKISMLPSKARWQMIGHLQSNKCRDAVHYFEMIQSVDSVSIAAEISKHADRSGKTMPILLEVNVAGEATKFGIQPADLNAAALKINALPRLELRGLMAIPPWTPDLEKARISFRRLVQLKKELEESTGILLPELSMGMSHDFEIAVEEGATIVRVGTAIFGERQSKAMKSAEGEQESLQGIS